MDTGHHTSIVRPDNTSEIANGITYKYSTSWIHSLETERHWRLYWHQHKVMQHLFLPGQHVLEVGVGSGFTAHYLRSKGVEVTTIDIDAGKKPDIVANIANHDFHTVFDHVLGFEIFEHIPYEIFQALLVKLAGVCRGYLFLSIPRNEKVWFRCVCKLPRLSEFSVELAVKRGRITQNHHFWEVEYGGITAQRLKEAFAHAGFRLEHDEKVFSTLFYVLKSPCNVEQKAEVHLHHRDDT